MIDDFDFCPGYIAGRKADAGVCSCGLHWCDEMPPHDRRGRIIPAGIVERVARRKGRALEAELRRARECRELEAAGVPFPLVARGRR